MAKPRAATWDMNSGVGSVLKDWHKMEMNWQQVGSENKVVQQWADG